MSRFDNMQANGLDAPASGGEGADMTRTALLIALAAAAALAGCNKGNNANADQNAADQNAAENAPIALPPPIIATKIYRCAPDNNVVTIDYLADNKSANVHVKDAPSVLVSAPEAGQPMTAANGYSVEGSATSSTAKITVPGHASQSCKA
jgi:uncharacterized lipoprotein